MDLFKNISMPRLKLSGVKILWAALITLIISLILIILSYGFISSRPSGPKHYRIAEDTRWINVTLHDKASSVVAFSNQLLSAIAEEEEIQISLYSPDINNLRASLDSGEYDAILTAVTPQNNLDGYILSDPFYLLGPVLVVRNEVMLDDLHEMEGKIVGIMSGSFLLFNIDRYPSLILKSYDSPQQALVSLDRDLIDGVLLDFLPAYIYTKGVYAGRLKVVTKPLNDASLRLIMRNTAVGQSLLKDFNQGLKAIKMNGIYDQLVKKWNLYPQLDSREESEPLLGWDVSSPLRGATFLEETFP